jgi:CMP-N,N'-diacetyllegionaminic acid synthase
VRVLGVIPARGGSKRIIRKNCRLLHNVPLIGYTIRAAQSAVGLTDFVVSTEDEGIKDIALSYGAAVVDRPANLAGDDVTSGAVLRHALDVMEDGGERYDAIVCLHPTSPIRDPKHIDEAIRQLEQGDYCVSVCKLPTKGFWNLGTIGCWDQEDRFVGLRDHSDESLMGDEDVFIMNASIYAMRRDAFLEYGEHAPRHHHYCVPLVMDRRHSLDINEEIDFKVAELYLNG